MPRYTPTKAMGDKGNGMTDDALIDVPDDDPFEIAGVKLKSRLMVGTGGYSNRQVMIDSIAASGAELVTASIRRISLDTYDESVLDVLGDRYRILPNTAGCETVDDVVLTAELGREAIGTDWVKLELIGDRETLYPDPGNTVKAAEELVKRGFVVLPFCSDDPVTCRRLWEVGCATVMPLGSPIGSGVGIANPYNIEQICARSPVPVVVDAGIGTASDATLAMELGCAAVLANSPISKAADPIGMAKAIRHAVIAGRYAVNSGRIPKRRYAEASSPQIGLVGS